MRNKFIFLSSIVFTLSSCQTLLEVQQGMQVPIKDKVVVDQEPKNCQKTNEANFKNRYFSKNDFDRDILLSEPSKGSTHAYLQDYKKEDAYYSGKVTYFNCGGEKLPVESEKK